MTQQQISQVVLVLSASQYKITDDKGNLSNEGLTVRYLATDTLEPCENAEKTQRGYKPAKANMLPSDYAKFSVVPALYQVDFGVNVDSQGKTSLKATDFRFVGGVAIGKAGAKLNLNVKET
jgi:hypothetical protein